MTSSVALLPVGNTFPRLNPASTTAGLEAHPLAADLGVLEVWEQLDHGTVFIALGSGTKHYHAVGTRITAHHDQSGRSFGTCRLVASRTAESTIGELPDRKLPIRVYK